MPASPSAAGWPARALGDSGLRRVTSLVVTRVSRPGSSSGALAARLPSLREHE